jgi:hypothetical protein
MVKVVPQGRPSAFHRHPILIRSADPLKLKSAHVVVTSYSIVASEYATFAPDAKDESKSKSKSKSKKAASQSDSDSDDVVTKKRPGKAKGKDALFRVKWFRIVLGALPSRTVRIIDLM